MVRFSNVLLHPSLLPIYICSPSLPLAIPSLVLVTLLLSAKRVWSFSKPQSQGDALASSWVAPYLLSMHCKLSMQLLFHSPFNSGMSASTAEQSVGESSVLHNNM